VLLNVQLHHDPYDIFSPDDGFSVFVTPGGARWKPDLTHGYNVALAGLNETCPTWQTVLTVYGIPLLTGLKLMAGLIIFW
jgi:hypothetical protein